MIQEHSCIFYFDSGQTFEFPVLYSSKNQGVETIVIQININIGQHLINPFVVLHHLSYFSRFNQRVDFIFGCKPLSEVLWWCPGVTLL
jgi:hypothetical protein